MTKNRIFPHLKLVQIVPFGENPVLHTSTDTVHAQYKKKPVSRRRKHTHTQANFAMMLANPYQRERARGARARETGVRASSRTRVTVEPGGEHSLASSAVGDRYWYMGHECEDEHAGMSTVTVR